MALEQARAAGPVLACYFHEPSLLGAPDASAQHLGFVQETLQELRCEFQSQGSDLLVVNADALDALQGLSALVPLSQVWAHAETTHSAGFARDNAVRVWARGAGLLLQEVSQNAVLRGPERSGSARFSEYLQDAAERSLWSLARAALTARHGLLPAQEVQRLKRELDAQLGPHALRAPEHLILEHRAPGWQDRVPSPKLSPREDKTLRLSGGRTAALEHVKRFLSPANLLRYPRAISSPLTALAHCSRLSPYLALGVISDRELFQQLSWELSTAEATHDEESQTQLLGAARFFAERLYWRASYLQMTENAPYLDQRGGMGIFQGLRESERMNGWLQAWSAGRTGFPYVDAAMRLLNATGWLNMRLRGTVTSFALNDLWLPWQEVGMVLAREFLDYEPAIHWNQLQIHAGVSAHSGPLTYDVLKQAREHDPLGVFVRQWVPELKEVPTEYMIEPWKMPPAVQRESACVLGQAYPLPLVRHPAANDAARQRVTTLRAGDTSTKGLYWSQRNQQLLIQGQSSLF
jgi:deoxyribodipyrimidine photo-lyase